MKYFIKLEILTISEKTYIDLSHVFFSFYFNSFFYKFIIFDYYIQLIWNGLGKLNYRTLQA